METIKLAYSVKGQLLPANLRAHSTRGMAASWALFKGIKQFVKLYKLDDKKVGEPALTLLKSGTLNTGGKK